LNGLSIHLPGDPTVIRSLFLIPAALFAGLLLPGRASAAAPTHPHLHHALHDLKGAVSELEGAGHNYGGHKEQALKDLKIAVIQIEKALAAVGDPYRKDFRPKADIYKDYKDHRHLRQSEHSIGAAIEELRESKHFSDAKDHKEKAIEALKAAHAQVKDCIRHAR
jgi:predicted  nucleic acid-binding Zn-ribbon protein